MPAFDPDLRFRPGIEALPSTLDQVERIDLQPVQVSALALDASQMLTLDKLGLGAVDALVGTTGPAFLTDSWNRVASRPALESAALWSLPFEDMSLEPALVAPELLRGGSVTPGPAGEAYAQDAAMTLASSLLGAPVSDWNEERNQAAFELAFGRDPVRQELRRALLGRRAYPVRDKPELGLPQELLVPYQDLLRRGPLVGLYKAMLALGAALGSAPRESASAVIERMVPDRGCPGTPVEIQGRGFGAVRPPGRWLVFPGSTGQVIVKVAAADWSDTLIRATAPPDVGLGPVGFIEGNAEAGEFVGPAAAAFEGEVTHALGPGAAAGMADLMQAMHSFHTATITPTQANWFRGGKPRIVLFTGNDNNPVPLRPSSDLVLRWQVLNADSVTIRKTGPRALPHVPGTLGEIGEHRFPPLRGTGNWQGSYMLTASNACGKVSTVLDVQMTSRSAWALGGGGAKGAFEVGAMRCLVDAFGLKPDIVSGASAGALNAAKIAEGPAGLAELENLWASLRTPADFFTLTGTLRNLLRSLGSEGLNLLDNVQLERMVAWHPAPSRTAQHLDIAATAFATPLSTLGSMAGAGVAFTVSNIVTTGLSIGLKVGKLVQAVDALSNSRALLLLDPVVAKLRASVKPAAIRGSGIKLRVAVTSLDTGATEYVTESGRFAHGGGSNDLIDALQASASIPIAFAPVRLSDGAHYSDGGVTENIPIEGAVRAGADDVIAILASPPIATKNFDRARLMDIGGRTFELLFDAAERRQREPYRGWGVPVRVIQPLHEVCSTFQIEAGLVQINRDYGYLRAYEEMQEAAQQRWNLSQNSSAWLRSRLLSWRESFYANGADPPDSGLVEIKFAANPDALELVRVEMQRQRNLMAARLQICAGDRLCLPPGIERSWLEWGPCDYVSLNHSPWHEMVNTRIREVPAATPPAAL